VVDAAREASDTIAERMRALDAVPDGRSDTVAATTSQFPAYEQNTAEVVDLITTRVYATVDTLRDVRDAVDAEDPSTDERVDDGTDVPASSATRRVVKPEIPCSFSAVTARSSTLSRNSGVRCLACGPETYCARLNSESIAVRIASSTSARASSLLAACALASSAVKFSATSSTRVRTRSDCTSSSR